MKPATIRKNMLRNAAEITRLKKIHDAFAKHVNDSPEAYAEWRRARAEFTEQYNRLVFPGGLTSIRENIDAGDPEALEAAICFLECRPYFFRSGYLFNALMKKCKRIKLSKDHAVRFQACLAKREVWKKAKKTN